MHKEVFAINDPESAVEVVGWRARVRCRLQTRTSRSAHAATQPTPANRFRPAYFSDLGLTRARLQSLEALMPGEILEGPAIIESPFTMIILNLGASAERVRSGSVSILPWGRAPQSEGYLAGAAAVQ